MRNAGLDEAQAGIKSARRNINNLRYADDTTLTAESENELKSLLMEMKEEGEKVGFKLNIQKPKIMASSPITSWQLDGETMEIMTDFIFLAPKSLWMVTAAMKLKMLYNKPTATAKSLQSCPTLCNFIVKLKEESEKTGSKLSIQKTKIMASGPITS